MPTWGSGIYIPRPMTRRYTLLAWSAAAATYLLIVLGGIVRITGSGMGCGDHWPVCNGRLFPPLDDIQTLIEWTHRLVAAIVSALVAALAAYTWWLRNRARSTALKDDEQPVPGSLGYVALVLLVVQVLLGAVTVKLALPPWTVILHLGTAMVLFATLLIAAQQGGHAPTPGLRPGLVGLVLATVLLGALVANLGAATACLGFPLCNGQVVPAGNYLQHLHWTHRLLAYALTVTILVWAVRSRRPGPWIVFTLVGLQVAIAAAMVWLGLPRELQAAHLAVGTAVWGGTVLANR